MDVTLTYNDGTNHSETFDALLIKGFDPVDSWMDFPGLFSKMLSGDNRNRMQVFNRTYQVILGVLNDYNDRLFVGNFVKASSKFLTFTHNQFTETYVEVVLQDPSQFKTEWLGGSEYGRHVVLPLIEKNARTDFPTTGIILDDNLYLKQNVIIAGTEDSPEEFVTGTGKLSAPDAPVSGYPTFNLTTTKVTVIANGARYGTGVRQVGVATESGGNLHFFLAADNTGNPAPDGYHRADITIAVIEV